MARALKSRIARLEKHHGGTDSAAFYLLWVLPGEDRARALAATQRQGKCPDGVPIYCAEWRAPESFTRRGRVLGQRPRSRVTSQHRLSEDEVAVLFEALGDDIDPSGFSPSPNSGDDVRGQQRVRGQKPLDKMTDRELVGEILSGATWEARPQGRRSAAVCLAFLLSPVVS